MEWPITLLHCRAALALQLLAAHPRTTLVTFSLYRLGGSESIAPELLWKLLVKKGCA